jgi:hypothetical protein
MTSGEEMKLGLTGGVEPVIEVFADGRGLQGRFDEDGDVTPSAP